MHSCFLSQLSSQRLPFWHSQDSFLFQVHAFLPLSGCCTKYGVCGQVPGKAALARPFSILFLGGQGPSGPDPADLPPRDAQPGVGARTGGALWEDQLAPTTFLHPEEGGVPQEGVKPGLRPGPTSELDQTLILCRSGHTQQLCVSRDTSKYIHNFLHAPLLPVCYLSRI